MPDKAPLHPSRRVFLKTSGLVAASAAIPRDAKAAPQSDAEPRDPEAIAPGKAGGPRAVDLVNLLQGTDSTPDFSRGNTLPIAALPFGMAHWTLQSHSDTPWMFQPGARRLQGLRCTHQLSPWLGDYGHASFLPVRGEVHPAAKARSSSYNPASARLTPYSLQIFLLRYRIQVELVPTERCAMLAATFEPGEAFGSPGMIIDIPGPAGTLEPAPDQRSLHFTSSANAGGVPSNFATFYVVVFSEPWVTLDVQQLGSGRVVHLRFSPDEELNAHIGTSFISFEQASRNLNGEIGARSLADLREAAARRWDEHLFRIEIDGATHDQQHTFYSCMYRALLFPRTWHEPDVHGAPHHFSAFSGKVAPGVMYADHGYWDVYRAWYPLMSILFPERLGEILQAWVNAYKEGGWLPQFPAPGYRACMTGSLIDAVFGDAAAKGIPGVDFATAYEGLRKHATSPGDPARGYGRVGLELYLKHHYVPADRISQSVAETVDAALGDFCIAQVARFLGKQEDADLFLARSENWRNLFDPKTKFLRGKKEDGSWLTPFDPFTWGSPYVEGAAWQHRWDVPHDIPGLFEAMGGPVAAAAALEQMLVLPPVFHAGVYGQEIHEMSEMAAVPFGQYAHGNQPVHHLLYLFAAAGRPDRTRFWVRQVRDHLYTPDTFAGDEDTGSMAAWYIFSCLGFYPICPGKPEYTLGSPAFRKATLHLAGDTALIVEATPGPNSVPLVTRNGSPHTPATVAHADLLRGGSLVFRTKG